MSTAVCRVCLCGGGVRMHSIEDLQLIETYENLANTKLNAGDGFPSTMCYICYRQLQKCSRFSNVAHRAERILKDLYRGTEVTYKDIASLNLGLTPNLSVSPASSFSTDFYDESNNDFPSLHACQEYSHDWTNEATVKNEYITVKEEEKTPIEEIFIEIEGSSETSDFKQPNEFHCKQCNKGFKSMRYLRAHVITHERQKRFSCELCPREFSQLSYYKQHVKTHTGGKLFSCTLCSKTFHRQSNLNKHTQTHLQEKSYECDQCCKRFKQKSHLKVHMRIHTGDKCYACEICGKTFNQIANLNKHMGIHSGAKPFTCELCGKAFLQRAQVKAHMRSHTGEKPYACDRCEMAFSHASPLKRHARLHAEAQPYACTKCFVSFSQESGLTDHMRVHAQRPFPCGKCNKAFTDARNLKRHDAQVHCAKRLHACISASCGKTFKRQQHLKKHMMSCRAADTFGSDARNFYQAPD